MRGKVKVPTRIALVVHGGLGQRTVYILRQIASQLPWVEKKSLGTAVDPPLPIHANDKLLAIGGMRGHVDLIWYAVVVQRRTLTGWNNEQLLSIPMDFEMFLKFFAPHKLYLPGDRTFHRPGSTKVPVHSWWPWEIHWCTPHTDHSFADADANLIRLLNTEHPPNQNRTETYPGTCTSALPHQSERYQDSCPRWPFHSDRRSNVGRSEDLTRTDRWAHSCRIYPLYQQLW